MISRGERAPSFDLPAVVDGDVDHVALEEYLGEDIVILAFYPSDFNPACGEGTTDLDELDLFTMQKDVSILGVSGDSVHSHRAFATEYDLHIPLLADVRGDVAAEYGVAVEDADAGYLTERAVVVIDPEGEVQYVWRSSDLGELPPVEEIRSAVDGIGGDDTARARYRVGHAHYVEGRRAFTSAMGEFEDMEWMMARGDFTQAHEEFEEAADHFNTAVRFAEDDTALTYYERAERKAEALWQAAEWLADAASAFASGEGAEGQSMRTDAEAPLETARDIHDPPDPDDFPPEEDPAELDEDEYGILPSDGDGETPSLDVDLTDVDDEIASGDDTSADEETETTATGGPHAGTGAETVAEHDERQDETTADDDSEEEIDEAELEEITAELEAQTKQAQDAFDDDPTETTDVVPDDPGTLIDDAADEESTVDVASSADDGGSASHQSGLDGPEAGREEPKAGNDDAVGDPDDVEASVAPPEEQSDAGAGDEPESRPAVDDDSDEDIELDLTDPTENESEEDDGSEADDDEDDDDGGETDETAADDDLGSGGHGVPDSL